MKNLLVGTDFSPIADHALDRAIAFAARDGAKLTLVYAEPDFAVTPAMGTVESAAILEWNQTQERQREEDHEGLAERCERARSAGVEATSIVRKGHADDVIPEVAGEIGADLVVIGTHGRTGIRRFLLGSVAEKIVRRAPCSVLVSRGETGPRPEFRKVLVATDFSPAADKALRQAIALSAARGEVELAHVWQYPPGTWGLDMLAEKTEAMTTLRDALTAGARQRADALLEQHAGSGRALRFELLHGPAASVLTSRAESTGADLIAVGTHGYRGFKRFLLGSVAEAVVRHAPCSVLVAHAEHPDH